MAVPDDRLRPIRRQYRGTSSREEEPLSGTSGVGEAALHGCTVGLVVPEMERATQLAVPLGQVSRRGPGAFWGLESLHGLDGMGKG